MCSAALSRACFNSLNHSRSSYTLKFASSAFDFLPQSSRPPTSMCSTRIRSLEHGSSCTTRAHWEPLCVLSAGTATVSSSPCETGCLALDKQVWEIVDETLARISYPKLWNCDGANKIKLTPGRIVSLCCLAIARQKKAATVISEVRLRSPWILNLSQKLLSLEFLFR